MKLRLSEDYVIDTDDYRREGFSMLLQRLSFGFKWENKAEFRSFVSGQYCKVVASTLNSAILRRFNITEIIVLTFF